MMKVFRDPKDAVGKIKNAVVTTGSFDGVHVGHKIIIDRLSQLADEIGGESSLVTFYPHPRKVLYPDQSDLKLINTQEEKIELLSKTGLDNLIIIPFSREFAQTTSHDFITNILIEQLNSRVIIVGHNHHFGHNRSGDFSYLHELSRKMAFQVEDIPLKDIENETVSSTKIRKALAEGNIMRANAYLDHQFIIMATMHNNEDLQKISDDLFFTSHIEEVEKVIPPPGIYATKINYDGECLKSLTLIADDESGQRKVSSTLLENSIDLDATKATLLFYKKIKGKEIFWNNYIDRDELTEAKEDISELLY
jgi:riboflavin kinase / FMN adenylyltransferase